MKEVHHGEQTHEGDHIRPGRSYEDETVFALVSDHGAKARNGPGHLDGISKALEDAGLMVKDKDGGIAWSRTRAVPQRGI